MKKESSGTHYRNAYKSDHLGKYDLIDMMEDGHNLIFTITYVNQEKNAKVAGKTIPIANIAYFKEDIKPLVVNAGNADILYKFTGSTKVENWKNIKVKLYIEHSAKLKGQVVGGVRIHSEQPQIEKDILSPQSEKWDDAIDHLVAGKPFDSIKKYYELSKENEELLRKEVNRKLDEVSNEK